jgi:HD superfamily phosphodiesterase
MGRGVEPSGMSGSVGRSSVRTLGIPPPVGESEERAGRAPVPHDTTHPSRGDTLAETIAGITVPDSALVRETTELVRRAADESLFNHSRRVFLFGMLKSAARGIEVDPELAYVGAMFHDLGLTDEYRTQDQRFEIDGAAAAQAFLRDHGRSAEEARNVWLAIALHTTPAIPLHLEPEVAVVTLGVETDVLGLDLDQISEEHRAEVVAAHPRPDFKNKILRAFYDGMADRPETTFGTMNDDVLAHFDPDFHREDFVRIIRENAWPE